MSSSDLNSNPAVLLEEVSNNSGENTGEEQLRMEILNIIKFACIDVYHHVLNGPDNMGMIKLLAMANSGFVNTS